MNRVLKDCMNLSCCKEEDICDIIDGLDKVVEDIQSTKKTSKEIEKAKEELREETKQALEELLDKINREKWVVGEYKWMPVGSKMPYGWAKVELPNGQTLIQGDEEGTTTGANKRHFHTFENGSSAWGVESDGVLYFMNRPTNVDTDPDDLVPFTQPDSKATFIARTDPEGSTDQNLPAGRFAELWQYRGIDFKKKCMKKCLEKHMKECMKNC